MKFKYQRAEGLLSIEAETTEEGVALGSIAQTLWDHNVRASIGDGKRLVVAVKREPARDKPAGVVDFGGVDADKAAFGGAWGQ